jgi:hypothetical protein
MSSFSTHPYGDSDADSLEWLGLVGKKHRNKKKILTDVRSSRALPNTGHSVTLSTVYASSAQEAISRFTRCVLQSGSVREDNLRWDWPSIRLRTGLARSLKSRGQKCQITQPLKTFPQLRNPKVLLHFLTAPVDIGPNVEKGFPLNNFRPTDFHFTCPSIRSRAECSTQTL